MTEPRYFENDLEPITNDAKALNATLASFKASISSSIQLVLRYVRRANEPHDSLYTGNAGIALMFLRVSLQFEAAGLGDCLEKEFRDQIPSIVMRLLPPFKVYQFRPGHISPLDSPLGSTIVYVLTHLGTAEKSDVHPGSPSADENWVASLKTLENAISCAVSDHGSGGDEVLYGRAGLLWAMLNLHRSVNVNEPSPRGKDIGRVVNIHTIEEVIKRIIEAGELGVRCYGKNYGEEPVPLMWPWHDKFYMGAIHGTAGILTVLLQAPRDMVKSRMQLITNCISSLCDITIHNGGHLPSSLPAKRRTFEYIQICHGPPGLLLLLATFRSRFPDDWKAEWEAAEALAAERVWTEGLVRKGLGLCHGISGNAWTLLLRGLNGQVNMELNTSLSRSLAFLLKATELPPLVSGDGTPFRAPDHPLSLFEGLAGAVCAWLDACIVIRWCLGEDNASKKLVLGPPGLGGTGPHGYL